MSEDITQDVFLKVWGKIKSYRKGESAKAWLFAIARNTTIDYLRKKHPVAFCDFEHEEGNYITDTLADEALKPLDLVIRAEDETFLKEALATLAPIYREVIVLHYEQDLTFDEIGKILGRPLHTVKSQHRRGLSKLREILDAPKE